MLPGQSDQLIPFLLTGILLSLWAVVVVLVYGGWWLRTLTCTVHEAVLGDEEMPEAGDPSGASAPPPRHTDAPPQLTRAARRRRRRTTGEEPGTLVQWAKDPWFEERP